MARLVAIVLILGMYRPDTLLAGVVFEAGEIDSNAVQPGAFVEVIYGQGERHPDTGAWEKLETVRGYLKAMDAEHITIGGRFWQKEIAAERVQKLTVLDSERPARKSALARVESNAPSEVVNWYSDERARQVIVAKGRYVEVTYRGAYGETEIAEGFVRAIDETELAIYRGGWRKTISRDGIDVLIVCDNPSQLRQAKRVTARGEKRDENRSPHIFSPLLENRSSRIFAKLFTGFATGGVGYLVGSRIGSLTGEGGWDTFGAAVLGGVIAYTVGVPIGVSIIDPHDQPVKTAAGSFMGFGAGIAIYYLNQDYWQMAFICPLVGAVIMSERSHNTLIVRQFSIGLGPDRNGNLAAIATLRF